MDMGAMMKMFQQMKGGGKGWGGNSGGKWKNRDRSTTVWVGGIPEGLTQEELKENFSQAGTIKFVKLTPGKTGIIEFSTAEEKKTAITMFNGSIVNGSALQVDEWTKKE